MELDTAIDTGRPFTMPAGNILHVHTSSPLLNAHFEESNLHHWQFEVRPSVPQELADKDIPLRLIAGSGGRAKQISYIPFRVTRMGRAEIALSSKSQLPIEVSLTVPVSKDVSCTFRARPLLRRADVQALHDVLEFLDEVAQSGELEIVSLEANSIISKATREKTLSAIGVSPIVKHITAESALISRALNVPLYLGDRITEEEVGDLPILRAIVTGEEFAGARVTSSFLKDYGSREHVLEILKVSSFSLKLYFPAGSRRFQVFGTPVEVGPLKLTADKTNFVDPDEILNRYDAAQIGERVLFQAHCSGPCRWSRLISEQQSPSAA